MGFHCDFRISRRCGHNHSTLNNQKPPTIGVNTCFVQDMKKVFTGYGLEKIMPYFSLQAGIALCDMDSLNGSTGVIPYSHLISDSDSLIAGN